MQVHRTPMHKSEDRRHIRPSVQRILALGISRKKRGVEDNTVRRALSFSPLTGNHSKRLQNAAFGAGSVPAEPALPAKSIEALFPLGEGGLAEL